MLLELKDVLLPGDDISAEVGVSFMIDKGEMACLGGNMRRGSVLLLAIEHLWPLLGGYVSIDGELFTDASSPTLRRFMSYLPSNINISDESVSGLFYDLFTLRRNKGTKRNKHDLFSEWNLLQLDHSLYGRMLSDLTLSERQRVLLSMICLLDSDILLLDNPLLHQKGEDCVYVIDYIRGRIEKGKTVVVTSNDSRLLNMSKENYNII